MCWQIDSLRRIYATLPFLTPAIVGFAIFASFLYHDVFGLDDRPEAGRRPRRGRPSSSASSSAPGSA